MGGSNVCLLRLLTLIIMSALMARPLEITRITAVEGGEAALPCNFDHPRDDSVFLILWFKGNLTTPIYNYDLRPGAGGSHWVDETVLGSRSHLDVAKSPALLRLKDILATDAGHYKCRVDFRKQPTKTTRVGLRVIVPAESVWVVSEGRAVTSVVGPYREGFYATLTCLARGGSPPPQVSWYFSGYLIDSQMDQEEEEEEEQEDNIINPSPTIYQVDPTLRQGSALIQRLPTIQQSSSALNNNPSAHHQSPSELYSNPSSFQQSSSALYNNPSVLHQSPFALYEGSSTLYGGSFALDKRSSALYEQSSVLYKRSTALHKKPRAFHPVASPLHRNPSALRQRRSTHHKQTSALHTNHKQLSVLRTNPSAHHKQSSALHTNRKQTSALHVNHKKTSERHTSPSVTHRKPPKNVKGSSRLFQMSSNQVPLRANTLTLGPFTRADLKKLITCEVSNTNLTSPLSAAVMIDMNLEPVGVRLLAPEDPLSYGRQYELVCDVRGSRPPPTITWWRGTTRAQGTRETTTSDGNITTSTLNLEPRPADDGTTVTCRAENPATSTILEQSLPLVVYYVPEAEARLGSSLDPQNIKEGDDVYFECSIHSNPRAYKVTWQHNGSPLQHNITGGIIVSNQSLVLQRVTRAHGGRYSCSASNIEGDGVSKSVTLDIKYAPVCAPGQMTTYGVARHEDAEVTCRVAANPPAQRFKWTFNNTADTIDVPPGRFTSQPTYSIITYTPMTELDYGTLLCWANNDIGPQTQPCIFHIVPAGKPDPPANCSVLNQTSSSFTVVCQEGFDGGLKQVFMLRVARPGSQGHNLTAGRPFFMVGQLEPDSTYRLQLWSANEKGVSPSVHLQAFTTHTTSHQHTAHVVAEVREGSSGGGGDSGGDIGGGGGGGSQGLLSSGGGVRALVSVVVGAGVGVVLLLALLVLLIRRRRHSDPPPPAKPPDPTATNNTTTTSPPSILKGSHTCAHREIQIESEGEVDPDLISQTLAQAALTPSGPLLQPPASYGGADPSFCEVVLARGDTGGSGGGAGAVQHHLLPVSHPIHPTSHTLHHHPSNTPSPPTAPASSSIITPHHHHHMSPQQQQQQLQQHLLPQQRYHQHPSKDPQFAHLDLEAGSHEVVPSNRGRGCGVPTIYATMDTRRTSSSHHQPPHVTFDLRHTHSQASVASAHDLTFHPADLSHQHSDPSRPLLADDVSSGVVTSASGIMVTKRESSV